MGLPRVLFLWQMKEFSELEMKLRPTLPWCKSQILSLLHVTLGRLFNLAEQPLCEMELMIPLVKALINIRGL